MSSSTKPGTRTAGFGSCGWEPLSRLARRTGDACNPHATSLRPVRPRTGPPPGGLRPRLRGSHPDPERGDPRGPRRSRRHRHGPDRVREDGRVPAANPAEAVEATSGANPRPRPLADPRARGPDRGRPPTPGEGDADPPRGLPGPAAPEDLSPREAARPRGHDVRPRVRPHEATRGPRGPAGRPGRLRRRPDPRGPEPESARDRPRRLPERAAPDPHRDGRRGPRHRRRGDLPRDQLRHPDRRHGLRAPGRADGTYGGPGRGDHVRDAGGRRRSARDRAGPRPNDSPSDAPRFRLPRPAASEGPRSRRRANLAAAA